MNLTAVALNGGEDYELLFTVPLSEHEKLQGLEGVHIIGHITAANAGSALVTRDGKEIRITAQGWNAFKSEEEK
jgi:thiamine-monophosphate kinase